MASEIPGVLVTREGQYPEEERQRLPNQGAHYCYSEELVSDVVNYFNLAGIPHIVDLGAGIGSLSHDFLNRIPMARITAIDRVATMNKPSLITRQLLGFSNYTYRVASAEQTGLIDMSVDLVICGQAFSLFRWQDTLKEVRRILRPGKGAALFFIHGCERACSGLEEFVFEVQLPPAPTPFMEKFWTMLKSWFLFSPLKRRGLHAIDIHDPDTTAYQQAMRTVTYMKSFFWNNDCNIKTVCEKWGEYNFSKIRSSAYLPDLVHHYKKLISHILTPNVAEVLQLCRWTGDEEDEELKEKDPNYQLFLTARDQKIHDKLKEIFDEHAVNGRIDFYHYVTVFYGPVNKEFLADFDWAINLDSEKPSS